MPENHPPYMTIQHGMSGYFACLMLWYPEEDKEVFPEGGMYDVCQTGIGRYKDSAAAKREADAWVEAEGGNIRKDY